MNIMEGKHSYKDTTASINSTRHGEECIDRRGENTLILLSCHVFQIYEILVKKKHI